MIDKLKGCFSHESDHWKTPSSLYNCFIENGYLDPCPFHADFDGLKIDYSNSKLFINPPYSKLSVWIDYAIRQYIRGNKVVLLIPARTDTKAFHKLLVYAPEIIFLPGRLHFNDSKNGAPFPSLICILDKGINTYETVFEIEDNL